MAEYTAYATVEWANPVGVRTSFKTIITDFGEFGGEQRKRKRLYPLRSVTLSYAWMTLADIQVLWEAFVASAGRYGSFSFFLATATPATFTREYVGIGDGTTTLFNLPFKSGTAISIYVNGALQTVTTDYTIGAGTGADGADLLTMVIAPADGYHITATFTGILKIRCRYDSDDLDFETFYDRLANHGITLQGLLNA